MQAIVENGLGREQRPASASWHRADGNAPNLAGQRPEYLIQCRRHSDETVVDVRRLPGAMPVIARRIPEEMIECAP